MLHVWISAWTVCASVSSLQDVPDFCTLQGPKLRRLKSGREASWATKKIWFKTPHQRPSILVKGQAHGLLQRRPKQVPSDQKHHWSPHQTIRQRQHPRQSLPAFPVSAWRDHNCPGTFSAKATSKTSSKWLAKCTWMLERISKKKVHLHRCNCWNR